MGVRHLEHQPPGVGGVVAHHEIHVVVEAGGPAAKGLGAVGVGKHVVAVPPPLGDGEGGVEGHPVEQVGPHAGGYPAVAQNHPLHIAPPPGGLAYGPPEGEGLPRPQGQAVQTGRRQAQVGHLAALEGHVLPPQPAQQGRGVLRPQIGALHLRPGPGKPQAAGMPQQAAAPAQGQPAQPQAQGAPPDGLRSHLRLHKPHLPSIKKSAADAALFSLARSLTRRSWRRSAQSAPPPLLSRRGRLQ